MSWFPSLRWQSTRSVLELVVRASRSRLAPILAELRAWYLVLCELTVYLLLMVKVPKSSLAQGGSLAFNYTPEYSGLGLRPVLEVDLGLTAFRLLRTVYFKHVEVLVVNEELEFGVH